MVKAFPTLRRPTHQPLQQRRERAETPILPRAHDRDDRNALSSTQPPASAILLLQRIRGNRQTAALIAARAGGDPTSHTDQPVAGAQRSSVDDVQAQPAAAPAIALEQQLARIAWLPADIRAQILAMEGRHEFDPKRLPWSGEYPGPAPYGRIFAWVGFDDFHRKSAEFFQEYPADEAFYAKAMPGRAQAAHLCHATAVEFNRDMRYFVIDQRVSPSEARLQIREINAEVLKMILGAAGGFYAAAGGAADSSVRRRRRRSARRGADSCAPGPARPLRTRRPPQRVRRRPRHQPRRARPTPSRRNCRCWRRTPRNPIAVA